MVSHLRGECHNLFKFVDRGIGYTSNNLYLRIVIGDVAMVPRTKYIFHTKLYNVWLPSFHERRAKFRDGCRVNVEGEKEYIS